MPAETREVHTRLLRLPLACEESRAYWLHARPDVPALDRAQEAFEERWFGSKSMARVRYLLINFSHRFDAFRESLDVLTRWRIADASTRQNICHWHAQLTDPIYREFSGDFLHDRRRHPEPSLDRDVVARWVERRLDGKWASATTLRMATALLTCATEAGLCEAGHGKKAVLYPKVPDEALAYLLYLLRGIDFEGTLLANPYLASVGLAEGFLEQRLRRLPGLTYHRMQHLQDLEWHHPDLKTWASATLYPEAGVTA